MSAAAAAGQILRDDFHRTGGARGAIDKAEADTEAERLIRGRLLAAFPDWRYLGEETGRAGPEGTAPIWLVDPNDGTRDYLAGRRGSAVSIGLLVDGRPALGVVFAFAYPDDAGDFFAWAEGCGPLRRNGRAVTPSLPDTLGPLDVVLVSSGGDRDPETNLRCAVPARYRCVPSIAHRLALVAAGEGAAAVSLFAPCAWDYAAGQALLRAANGVLVDESGAEVAYDASGMSHAARAFGARPAVARALASRPWEAALRHVPAANDWPVRLQRGRASRTTRARERRARCWARSRGQPGASSVPVADAIRQAHPGGLRAGGRRGLAHAGGPADGRLGDGARTRARDRGRGALRAGGGLRGVPRVVPQPAVRRREHHPGRAQRVPHGREPGERLAHARVPPGRAGPRDAARPRGRVGTRGSALTHPHPVCGDAVAAFVVAVADGVRHGDARHAWSSALSGHARPAPPRR